jgi:hypothetical protein
MRKLLQTRSIRLPRYNPQRRRWEIEQARSLPSAPLSSDAVWERWETEQSDTSPHRISRPCHPLRDRAPPARVRPRRLAKRPTDAPSSPTLGASKSHARVSMARRQLLTSTWCLQCCRRRREETASRLDYTRGIRPWRAPIRAPGTGYSVCRRPCRGIVEPWELRHLIFVPVSPAIVGLESPATARLQDTVIT